MQTIVIKSETIGLYNTRFSQQQVPHIAMNYFENLVVIGVIAMTKNSIQDVVINKEIGVGVSVS